MAGRRQFHLPRRARLRVHRRRGRDSSRCSRPGSACCARRDVPVLQRGNQPLVDHAGDPRVPRRADAADRHQGQRALARAPPRLHGLCRRQALRRRRQADRRVPHRRPVHLDRLYALDARRSPICAARSTRCSTRAGFDPDGHSGKALVNVLETYPRDELFQIDEDTLYRIRAGDPAARRAAARARAGAARPLRPLRLGARLRAARALRQRRARGDRRLSRRGLSRATSARSIRSFRKGRWCACISSSAATPGDDARSRPRRRSKPRSARSCAPGPTRSASALRAAHDPAAARALFERYRDAFSDGYREAYSPATRSTTSASSRALSAERPLGVDFHRRAGDDGSTASA